MVDEKDYSHMENKVTGEIVDELYLSLSSDPMRLHQSLHLVEILSSRVQLLE